MGDELDLCSGLSRIDVAVINGVIHGYEIKSEEDTLKRLPIQMSFYNKSLEKITVATNPVHLNKIKEFVPK
ncbi:MAG: sce7726 family protein [Bacteroidota bacterium]